MEGILIEKYEFQRFLEERKEMLYNLTVDVITKIEIDTIAQLNNIIYLSQNESEKALFGKKYNGQDATGYGRIWDCVKYLEDRYGNKINLKSQKSLAMKSFTMSSFESNVSNCTLTAITRILVYYQNRGYNISMGKSNHVIYEKVKAKAKKYGYSDKKGLDYTKINDVVDDVLEDYGYPQSKCKAVYIWTFDKEVKKEIDNNHPVIMNIARGYYKDHTVTVCGYAIYKESGLIFDTTHHMIQVYDGWNSSRRYIDYEKFAYDLVTSGFGSFNIIKMK